MGVLKKLIDEISFFHVKNDKGEFFYRFGEYHKVDGPAAILIKGDIVEKWYYKGRCHRDDGGPAITYRDGTLEWCCHGFLHSYNDKPAIIHPNGSKVWYHNGHKHRINGPAFVYGYERPHEFWLMNKKYNSVEDWIESLVKMKYKTKQESLLLYLKWR